VADLLASAHYRERNAGDEMIDLRLGDCLEVMKTFPGDSVDLTVTSPPYDNLRAYKGYSFDFEPTARELYRVTKPGGVVVWVVGDETVNFSETGTSFRQALYFKEIGFNLHDTMIYKKINIPPQVTHTKRYTQAFEYMFVFSKGKVGIFNPIKIPCVQEGTKRSYKDNRESAASVTDSKAKYNRMKGKKWVTSKEKIATNIWEIFNAYYANDKIAYQHPAIFPESLARDHILSWSNPGDTVLDPMMGSGTTGKMAVLLERNFIGIEISAEYMEIARRRIEAAQQQLTLELV
jgi:DNA modification methylase